MKNNAGEKFLRDNGWIKIPVTDALCLERVRTPIAIWCKHHLSNNNYYYNYASSHWGFENEQDAIMFKLRWSEYVN